MAAAAVVADRKLPELRRPSWKEGRSQKGPPAQGGDCGKGGLWFDGLKLEVVSGFGFTRGSQTCWHAGQGSGACEGIDPKDTKRPKGGTLCLQNWRGEAPRVAKTGEEKIEGPKLFLES